MGIAFSVSTGSLYETGNALEQIEVLNARCTNDILQRDEFRDGCHLTTTHLDEDIVERRRIEAILRRGTGHDAIHLTKLIVVADITSTAIST